MVERFGRALCEDSLHRQPARRLAAHGAAAGTGPCDTIARLAAGACSSRHRRPARPMCCRWRRSRCAFQADAELWLDRLAGKAGLDVGPVRPLRPVTIDKWRFAIRQLASALVLSGRQPATLTGLADLVTPEAAAAILGFFLERAGNRPVRRPRASPPGSRRSPSIMSGWRRRSWPSCSAWPSRLTPPAQGMTDKNRATLRQFADPAMQRRLVQPAGRAVRPAADARCPAQAAGAAAAVGPGRRAPAGGADAAEATSAALELGPAPAAQRQRPARALVRRHPGRGGQERPADRAAAARAHRPAAGDLSRPGPAGAGGSRARCGCSPAGTGRKAEVTLGPQIRGFSAASSAAG